ncbi:hypothetical protein [Roseiflexus castenholzii]|uniref:hypothetical protein n=1 Tax=Roseiflexus castenholzii TaxID=120962 RepID=UPI0012EE2A6D|nr:hypothetical protein [Roseiflexus castenholzii]
MNPRPPETRQEIPRGALIGCQIRCTAYHYVKQFSYGQAGQNTLTPVTGTT